MNDAVDAFTDGRTKNKWDHLVDLLVAYKHYIGLVIGIIIVTAWMGWISVPELEFWHWFIAASFAGGLTIGTSAVLYELSDYLEERRVRVSLAPVNSGVHDVISIPRKTFAEFKAVGTFPTRRLLSGGEILVARAIDFERKVIVPAQEFDDDKYPDDLDLIGEDADGSQIQKYRAAMLKDARERHEITVDQEVIRESAMRDAVDMFSKALRDVRDGDIELAQMTDEQVAVQAEQIIQQASQASEGSGDE